MLFSQLIGINFHGIFFPNCGSQLPTFLKISYFVFKKETHTGLKQLEGE